MRWRNVEGTTYQISETGLLKQNSKPVKCYIDGKGYVIATLIIGGVAKWKKIHHLVAAAFIGPRPEGSEIDHKDFVRSNNHYRNLAYATHAENVRRSIAAGRPHGRSSTITAKDAKYIKKVYKAGGVLQKELASKFHVDQKTISNVIRGVHAY